MNIIYTYKSNVELLQLFQSMHNACVPRVVACVAVLYIILAWLCMLYVLYVHSHCSMHKAMQWRDWFRTTVICLFKITYYVRSMILRTNDSELTDSSLFRLAFLYSVKKLESYWIHLATQASCSNMRTTSACAAVHDVQVWPCSFMTLSIVVDLWNCP